MKHPSPILLFDAMDTLIKDPFYTVYPAFFNMPLSDLLRLKNPDAWPAFERGELSEVAYAKQAFRDNREYDYAGLKKELRGAYVWIEGMESLIQDLKGQGAQMHIMSNYPVWYQMLEQELNLSKYLPWTFVSCETGVRKPDRECYLRACERLNCPPSECVLIDDRRSNCEGAQAVGMQGILFQGATSLRHELTELGFEFD